MKNKIRSGVTLVEVLVTAVLASMVMGSAMGVWSYARRNMSRTTTRQILQQDARRVLAQLQADLKAAKAETFNAVEEPMSLTFSRYIIDPNDNEKLSEDKTEDIEYTFTKPILKRTASGKIRTLSKNIEKIRVTRKKITDEERESDPYLESRVDIELELLRITPGVGTEETFAQHTSTVMRDDYYKLANKERADVFEIADEVAEEISQEQDSSFFKDELDAESLAKLEPEQLDDLEETQDGNLKEAKDGLDEINDRISNVDTGKKWYQGFLGLWKNEDGADVEDLRNKLKGINCPDKNIPEKGSGERASEKVDDIISQLDDKINDLGADFLKQSFGDALLDEKSDDSEVKQNAEQQRRAYEMKIMDRQIEKAQADMSEEDRTAAQEAGELPQKMIDQFYRSENEVREEIRSSGITEGPAFEEMVQKEMSTINYIKDQYDSCDLAWMDDKNQEDKIKAYEGAKQLKSLAESKRETLKLKELAIDNKVEIDKAREMQEQS